MGSRAGFGIHRKLLDDFYFAYTDGRVHVCNVPSPAATALLTIGQYVVDTAIIEQINLRRGGCELPGLRGHIRTIAG
jgi:hypothetical protein